MRKKTSDKEAELVSEVFESPKKARLNKKFIRSPFGACDVKEKLLTNQHVQYYSGVKANMNLYHQYRDFSDNSDDEDSMFGSFNPNLNTKENSYNRRQSS
jgi:hypothetical protein